MSVCPDEGRPTIIEGDDGMRLEFVGDVELNPAAAKVLLRILRKHADRQEAEDVSSRPVSASTDRAAAPTEDGPVPPDGDDEVGPLRLGTAPHSTPTPTEGANTAPE